MRRLALALLAAVLASGCGTAATAPHLSTSFGETFAGLYVLQQRELGRTDVSRTSLRTQATCRRTGAQRQGPGEDWVCNATYVDADTEAMQAFEVQVKPDGCWKAEAPATAQPALLADPLTGRSTVNHLAEFDGCLDTSWT